MRSPQSLSTKEDIAIPCEDAVDLVQKHLFPNSSHPVPVQPGTRYSSLKEGHSHGELIRNQVLSSEMGTCMWAFQVQADHGYATLQYRNVLFFIIYSFPNISQYPFCLL